MKHMISTVRDFYNTTNKEVRWWAYAAWTAPFTALAVIFLMVNVGWSEGLDKVTVVIAAGFFTASVYWWWWAIFKLAKISNILLETAENLKKIGREMREVGKEINDIDK